jgi:uroporphyrinogen decarboxylase
MTDVEFVELRYSGKPAAFLRGFRALYLGLPINLIIMGWVNLGMAKVLSGTLGLTALLGFCGAPWTLAAYLVEGRGAKEFPTLRGFAAAEPELLDRLLTKLTDLMVDYLMAQHAAGADAVQIFDSWAGLLSLHDWQRLIEPHLKRLLTRVGDAGIPRILFLQNAPHLVDAYAKLPAEVLATDWRLDLGELQRRYKDRSVQGNIDPAILLAGPDATRAAAARLLESVDRTGHIVNLGHGILPTTPIASVEALIQTVQEETR